MEACDLMIWQFPLWWFGLPGMLKGCVDGVEIIAGTIYCPEATSNRQFAFLDQEGFLFR